MTKIVTIKGTVRLAITDRLAEIARQQGKAMDGDLIRDVPEGYVASYDRDAKLIQKALEEAQAGGSFVPGEDMEAWAKSLGTDYLLPRPKASISTRITE